MSIADPNDRSDSVLTHREFLTWVRFVNEETDTTTGTGTHYRLWLSELLQDPRDCREYEWVQDSITTAFDHIWKEPS